MLYQRWIWGSCDMQGNIQLTDSSWFRNKSREYKCHGKSKTWVSATLPLRRTNVFQKIRSSFLFSIPEYNKCTERSEFCLNGATCERTWTSARCQCAERYQGEDCGECVAGYYGERCGKLTVVDLGFPRDGGVNPPGAWTHNFANVFLKTAWNRKNLDAGGGACIPHAPPPPFRSANEVDNKHFSKHIW